MADKEDFQVRNKKTIKIQKSSSKKNNLRNNYIPSKKFVQSSEDSEQQCFIQKTLQKGSLWWSKTNVRFFRCITPQCFQSVKQKLTTQQILECKYPAISLGSYFLEKIVAKNVYMGFEGLVRVLYRREVKEKFLQHYQIVTYTFKLNEEPMRRIDQKVLDNRTHIISFKNQGRKNLGFDQSELEYLSLEACNFQSDKAFIQELLKFQVKKKEVTNQIDRQIQLWNQELFKANPQNVKSWEELEGRIKNLSTQDVIFDQQIMDLKRKLRMTQILLYFKLGHSDKTEQMLDDATEVMLIKQMSMKQEQKKKKLTKIERMKSLFETDCKICFCTESDDKNRVLYCDSCNTSFHQSCYGVQSYSLEDKFYCEVCLFLTQNLKTNDSKVRKPVCQICSKSKFPMKNIEGHFYHVTCLILFGLVQIRDYKIGFKKSLDYHKVIDLIIENQIQSSHCYYCLKECGMKFKCNANNCSKYFHPICAYLNGECFNLSRNFQTLTVQIICKQNFINGSNHNNIKERNYCQQVYFRRFFCDYKGTSNLTEEDFKLMLEKEEKQRLEQQELKLIDGKKVPSLRKMKLVSNILSKNILKRQTSGKEKSEKSTEIIQPSNSMIGLIKRQNCHAAGAEQFTSSAQPTEIETETRKLLKRINESSMKE